MSSVKSTRHHTLAHAAKEFSVVAGLVAVGVLLYANAEAILGLLTTSLR